jgi:hypothetical protein
MAVTGDLSCLIRAQFPLACSKAIWNETERRARVSFVFRCCIALQNGSHWPSDSPETHLKRFRLWSALVAEAEVEHSRAGSSVWSIDIVSSYPVQNGQGSSEATSVDRAV